MTCGGEHFVYEVETSETSSLGTYERTAVFETLAGEDAAEVAGELLVLSEEEADFAAAHADVAGRNVDLRTDVAIELVHEGLAETLHFGLALAAGAEVGTTLATAHGERSEGILEGLLKSEELEYGEVYGSVETQTALVGTDGAVELHAVAEVHLNLALVVYPRHTEGDDALGLYETFEQTLGLEFGMLVVNVLDGYQHFTDSLEEFCLTGMAGLQLLHKLIDV